MAILLLMNLTLCLTLLDIAAEILCGGALSKKEKERSIGKGKVKIRKVYNKGMCLNMFEDNPELVKISSALPLSRLLFIN